MLNNPLKILVCKRESELLAFGSVTEEVSYMTISINYSSEEASMKTERRAAVIVYSLSRSSKGLELIIDSLRISYLSSFSGS